MKSEQLCEGVMKWQNEKIPHADSRISAPLPASPLRWLAIADATRDNAVHAFDLEFEDAL